MQFFFKKYLILLSIFFITFKSFASISYKNELAVCLGNGFNFTSPVNIKQAGYPDIKFNAVFKTEPFTPPLYYVIKYSRCYKDVGFELEFIHHKLISTNNPELVTKFDITNGYNMLSVNVLFKKFVFQDFDFLYKFGAGIVLSHPESTVRGKKFSEHGGFTVETDGYFVSGVLGQAGVGVDYKLSKRILVPLEVKLVISRSTVPVYAGLADVTHSSIHVFSGLKFLF